MTIRHASSMNCKTRVTAFPNTRAWFDSLIQAPMGVDGSIILEESSRGGWNAYAGFDLIGTVRRASGETRKEAMIALDSIMVMD